MELSNLTSKANSIKFALRALTALVFLCSVLSKPLMLEPLNKAENLEEVGVIFVQGALIGPEKYQKICEKIQEANSAKLKVWVSITDAFLSMPLSLIGKLAIEESKKQLFAQGLPETAKIYLIGHSLGGKTALDYYIEDSKNPENAQSIEGVVMLGSIPQRTVREASEHLNVLVLGGELDGLSRLTRLAEEFYHRNLNLEKSLKNFEFKRYNNTKTSISSSSNELKFLEFLENENSQLLNTVKSPEKLSTSFAVIALEGLNHMSFASGAPSWFVAQRDLKAEVTQDAAHEKIAKVISSFLNSDVEAINAELRATQAFLKPIIEAFELEGSIHFNRPNQSKCHRGYCSEGSAWTIEAQKILSQENIVKANNVTLNITNDYVILSSLPPLGDLFHPKRSLKNGTLSISTYSQCTWDLLDKYLDGGFAPVSAREIGSKMFSRQCSLVYGANRTKEETPITVDTEGNICQEINKQALAWAFSKASPKALNRFEQHGQKINFVDDKYYVNGFSWTYSVLKWEENKETGDMDVRSFTMVTDIDAKPLPIFAPDGLDCYHYCKLLSPARALEWVLVDGLRKNYGIDRN